MKRFAKFITTQHEAFQALCWVVVAVCVVILLVEMSGVVTFSPVVFLTAWCIMVISALGGHPDSTILGVSLIIASIVASIILSATPLQDLGFFLVFFFFFISFDIHIKLEMWAKDTIKTDSKITYNIHSYSSGSSGSYESSGSSYESYGKYYNSDEENY